MNKQAQKKAMVQFINENGGKANMNMKHENIEAMFNQIKANKQKEVNAMKKNNAQSKKGNVNAPQMITLTQEQLDKKIAAAQAPLMDAIAKLTAILEAQQQPATASAPKAEAPAKAEGKKGKKAKKEEDTVEDVSLEDRKLVRDHYQKVVAAYKAAHEEYLETLRSGDKKAQEAARQKVEKLRAHRREMEGDPTIRESIADVMYSAADITREYGHKGVDAIANILHMGVDGVANLIEAGGRLIDSKDRLTENKRKFMELKAQLLPQA